MHKYTVVAAFVIAALLIMYTSKSGYMHTKKKEKYCPACKMM